MFLIKNLLSAWLLPPLGLLIVAMLALALGKSRRSRMIAVCSVLLTLLLSLPIVADQLSRTLEGTPISAAELDKVQAIVILGAGVLYGAPEYGGDTLSRYSLERARYGARLARQTRLPVLVTGGSVFTGMPEGELLKNALEREFGVPVKWTETESRDTAENALYSARQLRSAGIQHIALVTHAWHMRRAAALFERQGIRVTPAPMGFSSQGATWFESLLPSTSALERSSLVIREWVAFLMSG